MSNFVSMAYGDLYQSIKLVFCKKRKSGAILGCRGHIVSVTTTRLCLVLQKAAIGST